MRKWLGLVGAMFLIAGLVVAADEGNAQANNVQVAAAVPGGKGGAGKGGAGKGGMGKGGMGKGGMGKGGAGKGGMGKGM